MIKISDFRLSFKACFFGAFFLINPIIQPNKNTALAENASQFCSISGEELGRSKATASTWANLRNNEGSLKYETEKLLQKGLPEDISEVEIHLISVPNKFLSDYGDETYCNKMLEETQNNPIIYSGRKFNTVDNLQKWIGELSQGEGADGKDLYKKCDKSCSPQYKYKITRINDSGFSVDAEIICGPARDKNDNMYELVMNCA
ncbi:MAG TPA: hypothetical protein PKA63_01840 [Oligoflexia bacterium]|nr:hypothetical protein [Oligoflexia bacterium]HMP47392.1 hypothetical protein [Oligoflexia bacterium]